MIIKLSPFIVKLMIDSLDKLNSVESWKSQIDFLNSLIRDYPDSKNITIYKQHIDLYRKKIQIARS